MTAVDWDFRSNRPWYLMFHDLMPYRAHEILLVSSNYDAFMLEEDGRLTESILAQYSELNLSAVPRITHVSTGAGALELLAERHFDLVLTMVRLPDTDVSAFGRQVKEKYPGKPVMLLVLSEADLKHFPGGVDPAAVDRVWVWTGDAGILLAIIKQAEDQRNCDHDTRTAGVRTIIVVEDSARHYSSFLTSLYPELMMQSGSLAAEGVNELHRLMRMKTRPKILLATSFEEAMAYYRRFKDYVVAVISDVRFPWKGEEHEGAGYELVKIIRSEDSELPILLQSAEPQVAEAAKDLGVHFADKNNPTVLRQIKNFVNESLGFGDFVFRLPNRQEVARAHDMYELEETLRWVPGESLEYHASRNHFSLWLLARSMFTLASVVKPRDVQALGGPEGVRTFLLEAIREARIRDQEGVITDFSDRRVIADSHFVRLRKGSIGGKARGLAFVSSLIVQQGLGGTFPELKIHTPRSLVIGTDEFDHFVRVNRIRESGILERPDQEILDFCLEGRLSEELIYNLKRASSDLQGPIAVRSSSLLEDSQLQPFAGIYSTYMLPNNHADPDVRFQELCRAIKAVYASTFCEEARAYIATTPYALEEEKMAVVIQEMVGSSHGDRFYPAIAGVALSYNYYPLGGQKADEGLAAISLGHGQMIVQGGAALQFSPVRPDVLPQFGNTGEFLRYSQTNFYGLDLTQSVMDYKNSPRETSSLKLFDLEQAEADGVLAIAGSVYSREDDVIRDNLSLPGARVVTFNNILKWNAIPLAPALVELLWLFKDGLGYAVEIEFAIDLGDWGKRLPSGQTPRPPCLYVLQVRPQALQLFEGNVEHEAADPSNVFCATDRSLGHGVIEGIRDIVFVKHQDVDCEETPAVAAEIGKINQGLVGQRTPYLLIGPGRWGSSDSRLGIPVKWSQISGARVIVETSFANRDVEPSQGAHFFHNVTSMGIGYLTVFHAASAVATAKGSGQPEVPRRFIDMEWLKNAPVVAESEHACHVRLDQPLRVYMDGRKGSATILKS